MLGKTYAYNPSLFQVEELLELNKRKSLQYRGYTTSERDGYTLIIIDGQRQHPIIKGLIQILKQATLRYE